MTWTSSKAQIARQRISHDLLLEKMSRKVKYCTIPYYCLRCSRETYHYKDKCSRSCSVCPDEKKLKEMKTEMYKNSLRSINVTQGVSFADILKK